MCLTVQELCFFLQNGDLFIYCLKNIVCCPMMRGGREKNSVCCQIILRLMLRRSHCFDALEGDPSLSERVGLRCKENFNFRYTASQCVVSTLMKLISWQISNICRAEVQRGRSEEWFRPPAGRTHRDSSEWILTGSPRTNRNEWSDQNELCFDSFQCIPYFQM